MSGTGQLKELRPRTHDEIHEAENFFGMLMRFIMAPYVGFAENGEMEVRRDEYLEARTARYHVRFIYPPNNYELGLLHGKQLQLSWQVGNLHLLDSQAEGAEEVAWSMAEATEGVSDFARGVIHGRISAARWVRGFEWDEPVAV